jgi:hypothetical protein
VHCAGGECMTYLPHAHNDAGGGSSDGGAACATDGGCGPGFVCGYPIAAACGATGVCVPRTVNVGACRIPLACGCDGGSVPGSCDLPGGYSPAPVLSTVPCRIADAGDASAD